MNSPWTGNYGDLNTQHAAKHIFRNDLWTTLPDIPGKPLNFGYGINNSGFLVGAAGEGNINAPIHNVPWIWDPLKGSYLFLSVPGAFGDFAAQAFAINDRGQVMGGFQDANGISHGFVKDEQGYTIIDVPERGKQAAPELITPAQQSLVGKISPGSSTGIFVLPTGCLRF